MSNRLKGICHLCLREDWLSYEHVPPRKAFNGSPILMYSGGDILGQHRKEHTWETSGLYADIQRRGAGGYFLCERCNNDTGRWYGSAFVEAVRQGQKIAKNPFYSTTGDVYLCLQNVYPLRIIKQIFSIFLCINGIPFCRKQKKSEIYY